MSKKIHLSENHTRALSSSLIVVEKSLSELEDGTKARAAVPSGA